MFASEVKPKTSGVLSGLGLWVHAIVSCVIRYTARGGSMHMG